MLGTRLRPGQQFTKTTDPPPNNGLTWILYPAQVALQFQMPTLAQNANFYRVALILGVTDAADVIAWADTEIEASTIPPNALIEVSMGRSLPAAAMISHLAELTENPHDRWSIHRAFGLVADRIRIGGISTENAILNCYRFLQSEKLLYDEEFVIFITYEDDLSLIRDGIFGADKIADTENNLLNTLDTMSACAGNAG